MATAVSIPRTSLLFQVIVIPLLAFTRTATTIVRIGRT
jgi:hypothetical protein